MKIKINTKIVKLAILGLLSCATLGVLIPVINSSNETNKANYYSTSHVLLNGTEIEWDDDFISFSASKKLPSEVTPIIVENDFITNWDTFNADNNYSVVLYANDVAGSLKIEIVDNNGIVVDATTPKVLNGFKTRPFTQPSSGISDETIIIIIGSVLGAVVLIGLITGGVIYAKKRNGSDKKLNLAIKRNSKPTKYKGKPTQQHSGSKPSVRQAGNSVSRNSSSDKYAKKKPTSASRYSSTSKPKKRKY